jgi:Trypsin-like peptidase domain
MSLRLQLIALAVPLATVACAAAPPETAAVCGDRQASARRSQCGPTLDLTPINQYQGAALGVQEREEAVVLINGSCTGTLIAASKGPVVITAGHCVALGDRALIAFNVEAQADGDPLVTNGTVIEQAPEPDYALIQLDQLPIGTPTMLTSRSTDLLVAIQHPRGRPKVIAEGRYLDSCQQQIYYAELDTLVGSSGAGVLTDQGALLGIHTDGDCAEDGSGSNRGWTSASVVEASVYLDSSDIADR